MDGGEPYDKRARQHGAYRGGKRERAEPPLRRRTARILNWSDDENEDQLIGDGGAVGYVGDLGGAQPGLPPLPGSPVAYEPIRPGRYWGLGHRRCLPEKGAFDNAISGNLTYAGRILSDTLSWIDQGYSLDKRIGEAANLEKLFIHGAIIYPALSELYSGAAQQNFPSTNVNHRCRVVVVLDKQSRGSLPDVTDVFSAPPGTIHPLDSMRNLAYQSRFDVLDDQVFEIGPRNASCAMIFDTASALYHWQWIVPAYIVDYRCTIPLDKLLVEYDDSATPGYEAVRNNNIFVIGFTDDSAPFNLPDAKFFTRLRFYP